MLHCKHRCADTGRDIDLGIDMLNVTIHRLLRNNQLSSHLLHRQPSATTGAGHLLHVCSSRLLFSCAPCGRCVQPPKGHGSQLHHPTCRHVPAPAILLLRSPPPGLGDAGALRSASDTHPPRQEYAPSRIDLPNATRDDSLSHPCARGAGMPVRPAWQARAFGRKCVLRNRYASGRAPTPVRSRTWSSPKWRRRCLCDRSP